MNRHQRMLFNQMLDELNAVALKHGELATRLESVSGVSGSTMMVLLESTRGLLRAAELARDVRKASDDS